MVEKLGKPVKIITNSFYLHGNLSTFLSVYSISFIPAIGPENRRVRTALLKLCESRIHEIIGTYIVTGNVLISKIQYNEPFSITTTYQNTSYIMTVISAGLITGSNINSYKMYANSVLKSMLHQLGLQQLTIYPNFYDKTSVQQIPEYSIEVWPGYIAAFSHQISEMILTIDITSKIIRESSVLSRIQELREECRGQNYQEYINSVLVGTIVMARYGNNRCYKIEEILFNENPQHIFDTDEGSIQYTEYYKKQYNIQIRARNQPLILAYSERGRNKIRLIPELCSVTGIDEKMRRDYEIMNRIAELTRLSPRIRLGKSIGLAEQLANSQACRELSDAYLIKVVPTPIVVDSFQIQPFQIKCGQKNTDLIEVKNSVFQIRNSIFAPRAINFWAVFTTEREVENREKIVKMIFSKAGQIGVHVGRAVQITYNARDLKNLLLALGEAREVPEIALVVIPTGDKTIYNNIKQTCSTVSGIPTQCLKSAHINSKRLDVIIGKLVIQMAVKTGSVPWCINISPQGIPKKTMVVGIDVFHDVVSREKSILGFVASLNPTFTSYFNTMKVHEKIGQEIAGCIGECFSEALAEFFENTKRKFYPECIVVYRDGVGDSQFSEIREKEVNQVKNEIGKIHGYSPMLVYVIVNKKTNTKLYVQDQSGISNPKPGTVVNSVIVPDPQSFYLISHSVTMGTVSPTLYRIISNDSGISVMAIANFAFNLCYLYFNWTGGIKVPAPTMMAHKLAYMIGKSVHGKYLEKLNKVPWFF